jgi:hypothetical protein
MKVGSEGTVVMLMMTRSLDIKSATLSIVISPLQFMGNLEVLHLVVLTLGISLS